MAKFLTILFFSCLAIGATAQNLVPNPSFEDHYDCSYPAYVLSANAFSWRMIESADYFNACVNADSSATVIYDVPTNAFGYQYAKTGNAYAGIEVFSFYNYREYAQAQLLQQLDSNKHYCVSFSFSLSDSSTWAVDKMGAYLSADTLNPEPSQQLPGPPWSIFTHYNPQLEYTAMMGDRTNWYTISGTVQAVGNEKYITIGNFRDDVQTDTLRVLTRPSDIYSYYYIDDISVEEIINAKAGSNSSFVLGDSVQLGNNPTENASYSWSPTTGLSNPNIANPKASPTSTTTYVVTKTQCSSVTTDTVTITLSAVGINETSMSKTKVFPNPADNLIQIDLKEFSDYSFELSNSIGQVVYKRVVKSKQENINTSQLAKGLYFLKIQNVTTNATFYDKIVISH